MRAKKTKMIFDFYKYLFFLNRNDGTGLIINITIFIISLVTLVYSNLDLSNFINEYNIFVIILFVYSLFNVIWSMVGKYKEIQNFTGTNKEIKISRKRTMVKEDSAFQLQDIQVEQRGTWSFDNFTPNQSDTNRVIRSKELNEFLWNGSLELQVDSNRSNKVKKFILKNRDIVTPFFQYKYYNSKKNKQLFFNQEKLCMSSDIHPKRTYVKCFKSNYYNSFLTNEISTSVLKRVEDATIIYDASNFYPCEYNKSVDIYYLQPIDICDMGDPVTVTPRKILFHRNVSHGNEVDIVRVAMHSLRKESLI